MYVHTPLTVNSCTPAKPSLPSIGPLGDAKAPAFRRFTFPCLTRPWAPLCCTSSPHGSPILTTSLSTLGAHIRQASPSPLASLNAPFTAGYPIPNQPPGPRSFPCSGCHVGGFPGLTPSYSTDHRSIGATPRPSNVKTRPLKPRCLTTIRPRNHRRRLSTWCSRSAFTVNPNRLRLDQQFVIVPCPALLCSLLPRLAFALTNSMQVLPRRLELST